MGQIKKMLVFGALALLLAVFAAACGEEEPEPTEPPGQQEPTPTEAPDDPNGDEPEPTPTEEPQEEEFDAAAYWEGQTITFITSSGPDGGTGVQLQYISDNISEFIPGNPRTVIRHQQPHVAGINLLWNSPSDGYNIGYLSHDPMREANFSEAQFTPTEFSYIGDVGVDVNVWMSLAELGYTDVQDLMGSAGSGRPELVMSAQAPNPLDIENAVLGWMLMAEWLDFDLRINAVAETATASQILDIQRGNQNTNEWGGGAWFLIGESQPQWWEEGNDEEMTILFNRGMTEPVPTNAGVEEHDPANWPPPHLFDLITDEQAEQYRGMVLATENLDRPIIGPPGMDENVRQALEDAFRTAFMDEEFCAGWTQFTGAPCIWNPSEGVRDRVEAAVPALERWAGEVEEVKQDLFSKYFSN